MNIISKYTQAKEKRPALICKGCKPWPNQFWPKLLAKIIVPAINEAAKIINNAALVFKASKLNDFFIFVFRKNLIKNVA